MSVSLQTSTEELAKLAQVGWATILHAGLLTQIGLAFVSALLLVKGFCMFDACMRPRVVADGRTEEEDEEEAQCAEDEARRKDGRSVRRARRKRYGRVPVAAPTTSPFSKDMLSQRKPPSSSLLGAVEGLRDVCDGLQTSECDRDRIVVRTAAGSLLASRAVD